MAKKKMSTAMMKKVDTAYDKVEPKSPDKKKAAKKRK